MKTSWTDHSVASTFKTFDSSGTTKLGYTPLIRNLKETHGTDITVLDYGCGPGIVSNRLAAEKIRHIEAVDISAEAIEKATSDSAHKSINFQKITTGQLPFSNDYFDATICCFVLVSIHDRDHFINVIRDIYRTLKPGGTCYILDINPDQTPGIPYPTVQHGDPGVIYRDGDPKPSYLKLFNGEVWKIIDTYWARSTYEDTLRSAGFTNLQVIECNGSYLPEQERKILLNNNITESPYLIFKATKP